MQEKAELYPPFAQKTMTVLSDQRNQALDELAIAKATIEFLSDELKALQAKVRDMTEPETSAPEVAEP